MNSATRIKKLEEALKPEDNKPVIWFMYDAGNETQRSERRQEAIRKYEQEHRCDVSEGTAFFIEWQIVSASGVGHEAMECPVLLCKARKA